MRDLARYLLVKKVPGHVLCDIHTSSCPWHGHASLAGLWAVLVSRSMEQSGPSFPFAQELMAKKFSPKHHRKVCETVPGWD